MPNIQCACHSWQNAKKWSTFLMKAIAIKVQMQFLFCLSSSCFVLNSHSFSFKLSSSWNTFYTSKGIFRPLVLDICRKFFMDHHESWSMIHGTKSFKLVVHLPWFLHFLASNFCYRLWLCYGVFGVYEELDFQSFDFVSGSEGQEVQIYHP